MRQEAELSFSEKIKLLGIDELDKLISEYETTIVDFRRKLLQLKDDAKRRLEMIEQRKASDTVTLNPETRQVFKEYEAMLDSQEKLLRILKNQRQSLLPKSKNERLQ